MASFRTDADRPLDKLLQAMASGKSPERKQMPAEQETPNPAPDKDYTRERAPIPGDEENHPEIESD